MTERYPGYDVQAKRRSTSWDETTRKVIDDRLAISREPWFFSEAEWATLNAVCARIMPQPGDRPPVPLAAFVDQKLTEGPPDGYRYAGMPVEGDAWRLGLAGLNEAAMAGFGMRFEAISAERQDDILRKAQRGDLTGGAWDKMDSKMFFAHRVLPDITHAYYAHPAAWSEIGFGGPASPRGYVRMGLDRRDPWEAVEAKPGDTGEARAKNALVR